MKNKNVLYLTQAAMIAALYVVLTMIANALGIASGNIQVRFSEALTVLPFLTPAAVPGLFIGCLIANLVTGAMLPDIIFGSLATLIGAIGTWSPRQGRKAEKAFHLAVPSAAYPGKRRDYPACVKIRLRHPSDVVFRDYRNGRGNHFLRYLRTDSVGCAEKIQKPVVPRLNGKNTKKVSSSCFLEVTIPFFFTCNRMHALRAFYCHEYAINRFPFSSNMLRASFMPFL